MQQSKQSIWPDANQEALLRASLLTEKQALPAWEFWVSHVDIDHLDHGSFRLLPLLFKNLRRLNVKHELISKLQGIYKLAWYQNQMLIGKVKIIMEDLNDNGFEILIFKGSALSSLYYNDLGVRPMNDFDILVKNEKAPSAIQFLLKKGWRSIERPFLNSYLPDDSYFQSLHGDGFKNSDNTEIDLHWHVLAECCNATADSYFWDDSIDLDTFGFQARTLNASDHLLHTCIHGTRWNVVPTIRWIADAYKILQIESKIIDWERILKLSEEFKLTLPLLNSFKYLNQLFKGPIPEEVILRLGSTPVSKLSKKEWQKRTSERSILGAWQADYYHYRVYSSLPKSNKFASHLFKLPLFFKNIWGVSSWWRMPIVVAKKLVYRIRTIITRRH